VVTQLHTKFIPQFASWLEAQGHHEEPPTPNEYEILRVRGPKGVLVFFKGDKDNQVRSTGYGTELANEFVRVRGSLPKFSIPQNPMFEDRMYQYFIKNYIWRFWMYYEDRGKKPSLAETVMSFMDRPSSSDLKVILLIKYGMAFVEAFHDEVKRDKEARKTQNSVPANN
jgi:hypothetical protein